MTRLRPCHRCRYKEDCELRESILAALPDLPVRPTLINFTCDIRLRDLPLGAVAIATVVGYGEAGGLGPATGEVVVMEHLRSGKLRVYNSEDHEINATVLTCWPDELEPTGEVVEICADCQRPMDAPVPTDFYCACSVEGEHSADERPYPTEPMENIPF